MPNNGKEIFDRIEKIGPDNHNTFTLSGMNINNARLGIVLAALKLQNKIVLTFKLSNNQISEIQPEAFTGLISLTTLSLANNKISIIQPGAFAELISLMTLYLYNNQISEIQRGAFAELISLTILTLSNNQISEIQPEAFTGLTKLRTLCLDGNPNIKEPVTPQALGLPNTCGIRR